MAFVGTIAVVVAAGVVVGAAVLTVRSVPDISRYLRIRRM